MDDKTAYYNSVADRYFQIYREKSPGGYAFRVRKKKVLELLDKSDKSESKALDVGCGPGIMVQDLVNSGFEFWGVDATPGMIEQCKNKYSDMKGVHFSVGDAADLKFQDGFFDLVICMGVIERVEKYDVMIKEMLRIVKNDGTLIIAFINLYSPSSSWRAYVFYPLVNRLKSIFYSILRRPQPPSQLSTFVKLHSERGATKLIRKYSGEVVDAAYVNFNVFLSPLDQIFPRLTLWVTERLEKYCSGRLKWLGGGFILKVKKIP